MRKLIFSWTLLALSLATAAQKFPGLAPTPPMGWNSWNTFKFDLSETLIREVADAMDSNGMKMAGYTYIILDDGWMERDRDKDGNLVPDHIRFPHGIKALADYVHARGLKLGIYNCIGTKTCGGYPGTRGYEYQDARLYAFWDIDYLKMDWCNTDGINAKEAYATMSAAIRAAGRPMIFSICEWGTNRPWEWGALVAHLWRTTNDIYNCFDCRYDHSTWYWAGPMKILDLQAGLRRFAGPGHWNDMDMLEVGNGLNAGEDRAHFSMWCMLASPLIAGNDIRSMRPSTTAILTNRDAIVIDQDSLGIQGFRYSATDSLETWFRPLSEGRWTVCFLNRSPRPQKALFNWKTQPVVDSLTDRYLGVFESVYAIRDVWGGRPAGSTNTGVFSAIVPPHDVILLMLEPVKPENDGHGHN